MLGSVHRYLKKTARFLHVPGVDTSGCDFFGDGQPFSRAGTRKQLFKFTRLGSTQDRLQMGDRPAFDRREIKPDLWSVNHPVPDRNANHG